MKRLIIAAALCSLSVSANAWTLYDSPKRTCNAVHFKPDQFVNFISQTYQRAPEVDDTWNDASTAITETTLTMDLGGGRTMVWSLFRDPKACAAYAKTQPANPYN